MPIGAAAASLAVSWQRWINPFVDSGREMDVPWRLSQGERLYRDVTYYYGPLGPWINALALRLFGNRWLVLEIVCAVLAAAILLLLFHLTRKAGGIFAATVATTLSAALCLGAPRGGAFLFPYSSSGLFALAGGLLALNAATSTGARRLSGALGLSVALASRVEVGAAAALALLLAGVAGAHRKRREERWMDLGVVALGGLLALGIYGIAFTGVPLRDLLSEGPFRPFVGMPQEWRELYLDISGLKQPVQTVGLFAGALLLDGVLLLAAARFALPAEAPRHRWQAYLFPLAGLLLLGLYLLSPWCITANNLPPVVVLLPALAALAALLWLRRDLSGQDRARFLLFFWSAAVAARVFFGLSLGPHMSAYSALPLPGLLATAAVLAFDIFAPRLPAPRVFRRRLAAILTVVAMLYLYRIEKFDHPPGTVALETAAGTLRLPARQATAIAQALGYLERNAHDGETLTAFPESGFFNFVLGLRSPLQQDLIIPGVLHGSREVAAARQVGTAGPRFVLLCNRPTPEYGQIAFGRDYATGLWREVTARYVLAESFGGARGTLPVGAGPFFIRLYERSPEAPASAQLPSSGLRHRPTPGADSLLSQLLR